MFSFFSSSSSSSFFFFFWKPLLSRWVDDPNGCANSFSRADNFPLPFSQSDIVSLLYLKCALFCLFVCFCFCFFFLFFVFFFFCFCVFFLLGFFSSIFRTDVVKNIFFSFSSFSFCERHFFFFLKHFFFGDLFVSTYHHVKKDRFRQGCR